MNRRILFIVNTKINQLWGQCMKRGDPIYKTNLISAVTLPGCWRNNCNLSRLQGFCEWSKSFDHVNILYLKNCFSFALTLCNRGQFEKPTIAGGKLEQLRPCSNVALHW